MSARCLDQSDRGFWSRKVATVPDVEPGLLEQLLDEAAEVEHCLLNTYLFAGCSLKSLPEEFATLSDGREKIAAVPFISNAPGRGSRPFSVWLTKRWSTSTMFSAS